MIVQSQHTAVLCGIVFFLTAQAGADVVWDVDFASWQQGAGPFSTIGFNEVPSGTWVTEEYAHLGVHFTDGNNLSIFGPTTYPEDGYGLIGWEEIVLVFDEPITAFASHMPGSLEVQFFAGGELLYHSPSFGAGLWFIGFISDVPFDQVRAFDDHDGHIAVDNLYFGPPIPAPPVLGLVAIAALVRRRRR